MSADRPALIPLVLPSHQHGQLPPVLKGKEHPKTVRCGTYKTAALQSQKGVESSD
ncbi:MAG TPA: hypothetical protein VGK74_02900 [Symbiobacteriaceae bacterium]